MKKTIKLLSIVLLIFSYSCETDSIDKISVNTDVVDEELQELINRIPSEDEEDSINCIEFNYWFNLFVFDENMNLVNTIPIIDNEQFSEVLGSLNDSYSISLSYPITGTLSSGETIEINNNEELKESIDSCQKDEVLGECNGALTQESCFWYVSNMDNTEENYTNSYFEIQPNSNAIFYYNNKAYFGSWTTYFIEDELHLNIFLNDDGSVGNDWNFDWKLDFTSDNSMTITNDSHSFTINRDCSLPCENSTYTVCEFEDNPGFAEFNLIDYLGCLNISPFSNEVKTIEFSFFETEEDANNNTNEVLATNYVNSNNPQQIFIRAEDEKTENLISIFQFSLEAISCEP